MKNQGISLISLIITIIVIIILAAIVIFTGLGTPDSAQFAGFTQQVDNVYSAVMNKFADLKAKHAISGDYRTDEQIYIEVARNADPEQYAAMNGDQTPLPGAAATGVATGIGYQNILPTTAQASLNMKLPNVRQSNKAWYVTEDGRVFNANGFTYDNKTYFDASHYANKELAANDTTNANRAAKIWAAISGDSLVVDSTGL